MFVMLFLVLPRKLTCRLEHSVHLLVMICMNNLLLRTHLNQTIIALNPTSMFKSLSLLPYTGLLGTLLKLTAHHLLLNFPVFQSYNLLKMLTSSLTFCALQ